MYSMDLIGAHVVNEEGVFIGVIDSIAENAHGVVITVEEMDEEYAHERREAEKKPPFELVRLGDEQNGEDEK